ncbi:MAG TPA: hypothetical protein VM299_06670 [Solirubrobacteraceae bacterium]|nr:hypothetical protein [Solirubrobacteraceae bacterium]
MRRTPLLLLALLASLALAPPASADLFTDVVRDYIKDSRLDVCSYTTEQLKKIKDAVPVDQNAYTPEFIAAVDDAIARRAEGACSRRGAAATPGAGAGGAAPGASSGGTAAPPGSPAGGTPGATATGTAAPAQPAAVQPPPTPAAEPVPAPGVRTDAIALAARTNDGGGDAPFPVLALAVLAGLLALGTLLAGIVRWSAWEPEWAHRVRHATGEAGWRASSTWAEFTDFVRFGR